MVKAGLIEYMAKDSHLTQKQAKAALNAFLKIAVTTFKKGEDIKLEMFGTFKVSNREQRFGRNPKTGERIVIPSKKIVKFKPADALLPVKSKYKLKVVE